MMKGLKVLGCPTVISAQQDPSIRQERLSQIMSWVRNGDIQPFVSSIYGLENVKQAMTDKWTGKIIGGAVLKPE